MTNKIIRKLEQGLILRHGRSEDATALAKFNKDLHGEDEWDGKGVEAWTMDLISGEGPITAAEDFTIVEDTTTGAIVSSSCLISQTWSYEGIPFKVGRPELVGTSKAYQRRGLVRQQFEVLHDWSAARGELVQAITGIPYYYRQFGYEMTLNLGGGRAGYAIHVPELKEEETESYSFRLAQEDDIPFLMSTYERSFNRNLINALRDEALWRYEISGKRALNIDRREFYVIEDQENNRAGLVAIPPIKWGKLSAATVYELAEGYAWHDVTPSVIRFLWQTGIRLGEEQNQEQKMFGFWLGESHPVYQVAATRLPRIRKPYSYFMRVPNLPTFFSLIKPVLEKRLSSSAFSGYTGEVKLSFYRDGLLMTFEKGELLTVKSLEFDELADSSAHFPPLVFLHLVFGHRSMQELKYAFTDCGTKDDENAHFVDALFPKKPSEVWAIA